MKVPLSIRRIFSDHDFEHGPTLGTSSERNQSAGADIDQLQAERFEIVQRVAGLGMFERDMRTGTGWWSSRMVELFGLDGPAPTFEEALEPIVGEDVARVRAALEEAATIGLSNLVSVRFQRGDELRNAEFRLEPLRSEGLVVGYRGTMQDVTERHLEARTAARELSKRAHLLDAVQAAVIATGPDGRVTNWNSAAEQLYGWSKAEAIGEPVSELTGSGDDGRSPEILERVARTGSWEGKREVPCKDGSLLSAYVQLTQLTDSDGDPEGVVGVSMDFTPQATVERDLRSARDYLQAITANMAEGLLTLDTNGRLTYMNDAGDRLLGWREQGMIGERIADLVGSLSDTDSHLESIARSLSRLRPGDDPLKAETKLFVGRDNREIEAAFTAAPFESELGEQGTVIVFRDITEQRTTERRARKKLEGLSWIGKIQEALASDRMVPFAQPIVELATGKQVRHELLVRLIDDTGEIVQPGSFLPTAEEFGLIVEIDQLMVRRAAEIAARGHRVSFNLSAQSITTRGMVELIASEIRKAGADPSLLAVEMTETALLESEEVALRFVERLAELGCAFALDDFGTGYGGFMYLKQLPIDYLKIDMEFVHDLTVNNASQRVVRAVVDLARGFGQLTIAEGIEDQATWDMLNEIGVDYGQGYLFGRPARVEREFGINNDNDQELAR